jgi:hypothetical protein
MTHKKEFFRRHGVNKDSLSKSEIASLCGISKADADTVYDRGVGAHKTNPESVRLKGSFKKDPSAPVSQKLSAEQWGYARLYAFCNKLDKIKAGKQKRLNQDCDIAKKYYKKFECKTNI